MTESLMTYQKDVKNYVFF